MRQAVLGHGGEAAASRKAFAAAKPYDQDALIEFLKSLQVLPPGTPDRTVDENFHAKRWLIDIRSTHRTNNGIDISNISWHSVSPYQEASCHGLAQAVSSSSSLNAASVDFYSHSDASRFLLHHGRARRFGGIPFAIPPYDQLNSPASGCRCRLTFHPQC
jgi:hypothetical protein